MIREYIPRSRAHIGLTIFGAAAAAAAVLRGLLRKKKDLTDKVVVITGASSGIGEALGHEFMKSKCRLVLAARSIDKLKRIKEEMVEIYKVSEDRITPFFLDLEDHGSIGEACESILKVYGRVDILINNAGIGCRSTVEKTELDTYKKVMDLNYFGQIAITKGLLPSMIAQGSGTIVAVSSLQGRFALPGGSAYGASKHALQAFCDSLRNENAKNNIEVLVVSPSYVKTNIAVSSLSGQGSKVGTERPEIEKGMSAESCAKAIINAIRHYQTDVLIGPFHHRLVVYIRALCPALYNYIMSRL